MADRPRGPMDRNDGDERARAVTQPALPRSGARRRTLRLLVVEDDASLASALLTVLGQRFVVTLAGHGGEALRAIDEDELGFDFVLSDVRMPWMNGVDLHRALAARSLPLANHFAWMSGDVLSRAHQEYVDRTGLPVFEKPFDIGAVERAIEQRAAIGSTDGEGAQDHGGVHARRDARR